MLTSQRLSLFAVCGLCLWPTFVLLAPSAQAQSNAKSTADTTKKVEPTDPRIGTTVMVTVDGATLRTPQAIVWKAYRGETFTVKLTNAEWLWIDEKGGWLWEKQTVPFDTAIQQLTENVQESPSSENYDMRGIAYTAHEQFDKAIADFTESLRKKPNTPGVLNNRGRALYLSGKYKEAVNDFDLAIRTDSKHFVAMLNRALCHLAQNNDQAALQDLNAAIRLNKDFPEALNNRGVIHARNGDHRQAVSDYSAAIRIDAGYVDAYGNRAAAYRKLGKYVEAITDLQLAMEKNPDNYKPYNDLAWLLATSADASVRKPAEAVALATKACDMTNNEDWNTLDTLAAAYAASGDFKAAEQWITTALEKSPEAEKTRLIEHQSLIAAEKLIVK